MERVVDDAARDVLEQIVKCLDLWRIETGRSSEGV